MPDIIDPAAAAAEGLRAAVDFAEYVAREGHAFLLVDSMEEAIRKRSLSASERAYIEGLALLAAECIVWRRNAGHHERPPCCVTAQADSAANAGRRTIS